MWCIFLFHYLHSFVPPVNALILDRLDFYLSQKLYCRNEKELIFNKHYGYDFRGTKIFEYPSEKSVVPYSYKSDWSKNKGGKLLFLQEYIFNSNWSFSYVLKLKKVFIFLQFKGTPRPKSKQITGKNWPMIWPLS